MLDECRKSIYSIRIQTRAFGEIQTPFLLYEDSDKGVISVRGFTEGGALFCST